MQRNGQALLILCILVSGCSYSDDQPSVKVALDLQTHAVSNTSVMNSCVYPILQIHNQSPDSIFVYYHGASIHIDSSSRKIVLEYHLLDFSDITYYEFPYPLIVGIAPNCNVRLYNQVLLYQELQKISAGVWNLSATIGYIERSEYFRGYIDHELRDRLTRYHKILKSNETSITVVKK
jgi:hypothetical protein